MHRRRKWQPTPVHVQPHILHLSPGVSTAWPGISQARDPLLPRSPHQPRGLQSPDRWKRGKVPGISWSALSLRLLISDMMFLLVSASTSRKAQHHPPLLRFSGTCGLVLFAALPAAGFGNCPVISTPSVQAVLPHTRLSWHLCQKAATINAPLHVSSSPLTNAFIPIGRWGLSPPHQG